VLDIINPDNKVESKLSLISETPTQVTYNLTNIKDQSLDIPINLQGISLSNLKIFSKEITDANISVSQVNDNMDYNLLYIDKIYSVFSLNITNQDKMSYISYDFVVDRNWLTANNVPAKDMIAYYIQEDKESILKLKYLGDSLLGSTYNITVVPMDGKIIIGSQTQEYKDIQHTKKVIGFVLLALIFVVLLFIFLMVIKIIKQRDSDLKEKPKDVFSVLKDNSVKDGLINEKDNSDIKK